MSGTISDRGRFVDVFRGNRPPKDPHVRPLRGAKGTIQMMVDGGYGCGPPLRASLVENHQRNEGVCRTPGAGNPGGPIPVS